DFAADSYATTFWVAFAIVLLTFVPAALLPRRKEVSHLLDDQPSGTSAVPMVTH
ncbi:MAG TPA: MFS transporter, partial [Actinoplanes sp.]|nr:MFS transporter [Actinoplanes sp.]